jgi:hypothetical protein
MALSYAQYEPLEVTIATDKSTYQFREIVNIYGNVTYEGGPVEKGLVAISIRYPNGTIISLRTVPAKSLPSTNWNVEIKSFISCDQSGNPKKDFKRDSFAYFYMIAKNNIPFNYTVLLTISVYDADQTPIGTLWQGPVSVPGNSEIGWLIGFLIPISASTGTGKAYANVYTDWPENGGYPYCPEWNTTFNIERQTSIPNIPSTNNTYQASFRLPPSVPRGTYLINVSAWYYGWKAFQYANFTVDYRLLGDVAEPWGSIDIYDVVMITSIYGAKSGEPNWNPELDLNPDGKIDIYDVVIVTSQYGKKY